MSMKQHLVDAVRDEYDAWEELLSGLKQERIVAPDLPNGWSVKDVVAHVRAWQSRSVARFEAAAQNREPEYPNWPASKDPDSEESPDATNAWIYETYRNYRWPDLYDAWSKQFLHLVELARAVPELELLDSDKYKWMNGYSLADVLLGTYDHHQEHLEKLQEWLQEAKS